MTESSKDTGVTQALIERFETQRLPRALALKAQVDRGELLSDMDLAFLKQVFDDAQSIKPLVERQPEWQSLMARAIALYKEITDKALANEEAASVNKR
ncbi:MAG: hypothetical protein H6R46_666 [Proteobacteria bacterium]|jgi:hypothetical protein|nr:hypothetical protein [Pseudomonadota bacterium]